MSRCSKCGNKLLTVESFINQWDADEEPYESGKCEDHEGIWEEVYFNGEYCEQCRQFLSIYIDADMLELGTNKRS